MLIASAHHGSPYNPPTGSPVIPTTIGGLGERGLFPVRPTPGCVNCVNGLRGTSSGFGQLVLGGIAIAAAWFAYKALRK